MQAVEEFTQTENETVSIFSQIIELDHEQVVYCHDKSTGLKSIIAIHNTTLGPALGGTRMWNYTTDQEALYDVLRLSRGMTYKAAISGINLGGGKAVIIGDSKTQKTEALFRRYGRFVNSLGGKYITAEDVGTSIREMEYVAMETEFVTGVPVDMGGSGDPSPFTAYGVYLGMKASVNQVWGSDSMEGKKVVVQGVGHVGEHLVDHLTKDGAKVFISDINETQLKTIAQKYGATGVDLDAVYNLDVDVYAPCAMGATLNDNTIPHLKCSVIAGAANNQLGDEVRHGNMLVERGILYAPDFLINAGGVINVYNEWIGYNYDRAKRSTEKIYERTLEIFRLAQKKRMSTHSAALKIAEDRLKSIGRWQSRM